MNFDIQNKTRNRSISIFVIFARMLLSFNILYMEVEIMEV